MTAAASDLRIVVTGLAVTYPFGGVFWDYVQYALGFARLGHRVLYLEDTGKWCYSPVEGTFVEDGTHNAAHFHRQLARIAPELAGSWHFVDAMGRRHGVPWERVVEFCREADLFLHVSASCMPREEYLRASRTAFLDSDPLYTQASFPEVAAGTADEAATERVAMIRRHDVFFTFGERVGAPDCLVPTGGIRWIPTRQPVVLDCFAGHEVPPARRRRWATTVCSWEPHEKGPVVDGVAYAGKSRELLRFLDLPLRSPLPLELALSGPAPVDLLKEHGWRVRPALEVSSDPEIYRRYLARSLCEWSVAKNAYVAARTGWFSCRSACYMALGVPVVVQDTAFSHAVPAGEGVLAFQCAGEAARALADVAAHPGRHGRAALELAREYFAHDRVLPRLLEDAFAAKVAAGETRP